MTGSRSAGSPWTQAEVAQLHALIASGAKVGLIAPKYSQGGIYSRRSSFKKTRRDLTSMRNAFAPIRASRVCSRKYPWAVKSETQAARSTRG
jgi:hypothetical protein